MTDRHLIIIAALTLLVGVAAGAFGSHGLKRMLEPELLDVWRTAVFYQLIHGLGLLAIAILGARLGLPTGSPLLGYAGALMFAGILLFSGSLYILALTGAKWLGAITPIGGLALIAAWAMTAMAAFRSN